MVTIDLNPIGDPLAGPGTRTGPSCAMKPGNLKQGLVVSPQSRVSVVLRMTGFTFTPYLEALS